MKSYFLFLLLILPIIGVSQSIDVRFDGVVSNMDKGGKESGVTISIIQGGQTVSSGTTSSNGRYMIKGKINPAQPFDVAFSKNGFVGKKVNFNFTEVNVEDIPAGDFKPIESLDMEVFSEKPGVDFSFLNTQPVGIISINSKGMIAMDEKQKNIMAGKIESLLKDADKKDEANELAYNNAIQAADKAYAAKEYQAAMSKYEEALRLPGKGQEKHPNDRIIEIDQILQKQKEEQLKFNQENAAYVNLITAADNLLKAGDLEKAKEKYYEASDISDEQYPLDKIKEINGLIRAKEDEAKYNQLIQAADAMYKQKSFRSARDNYLEASKLKPNEQYPKDKIKELEDGIKKEEDAAAKKQQYEKLLAEGDQLVKEEKWEDAKGKFDEALKIEPASTYAKGQLELIAKKIAEEKAEKEKQEKIAKLLQEAETAYTAQTYDVALAKYKEVITLDNANTVAPPKITEIEQLLADEAKNKELNEKFNALVKQGDDAVVAKKLEDAINKYKEALTLKEDEPVKTKLQDAEKALSDIQNAKKLEEDFAKLIAEGQTAYTAKDYTTSLSKYEAALQIKPTDEPTVKKVAEIQKLIADQQSEAEKLEKISKLIQEGTELMEGGVMDGVQLEPAKAKFNEVLVLDPKNAIAKQKITEIDKLLLAEKNAADKEAQFNENVAKGDAEMTNEAWEKAIGFYNTAIGIKEDAAVRKKIVDAQTKLNEQTASKELNAKYDKAIKEADALRDGQKLKEALAKYQEALALKASETYPQQEIEKINQQIAANADKAKIDGLLAEGLKAFTEKKYTDAQVKYNEVIAIDATNETAKNKLTEIASLLNTLEEEKAKEEEFAKLKTDGLNSFASKDYNNAMLNFEKALNIKNDAEIQKAIAEITSLKKDQEQKTIQIEKLLAKGKNEFDAKSWDAASSTYNELLVIDPDNTTAKSQLALIQSEKAKLLNEAEKLAEFNRLKTQGYAEAKAKEWVAAKHSLEEALKLKEDAEVSQKLEEIKNTIEKDAQAEQLEKEYNSIIKNAEVAEAAKDYSTALTHYTQASALKPNEQLPKNKIVSLKALIEQQTANSEADKKYNDLLSQGDALVSQGEYTEAIQKFNEALAVKPNEQLPVIKAEQAEKLALEKNKTEQDTQFEKIITAINTKIDEEDYKKARDYVNTAKSLRPTDPRPDVLLAKIESIEKENETFNDYMEKASKAESAKNYTEAVSLYEKAKSVKPSHPEPIAKIESLRQLMNEQMDAAEKAKIYKQYYDAGVAKQSTEEYELAINNYRNALNAKPNDTKALEKIAEVEALIAKKEAEKNALLAENDAFNKVILEADDYFNQKNYQKAGENYRKALTMKPNDAYAKKRLKEAEDLNRIESEMLANQQYQKILDVADGHMNNTDYDKAMEYYNRALSIKSNDPYPKKKIEEINAILNPVAESSADLQPLGEPFDGSVLDGEVALQKAESERKEAKRNKVKNVEDRAIIANEKLTDNKKAEQIQTISTIYDLYTKIISDNKEDALNKIEIADKVHVIEERKTQLEAQNTNYKTQSNYQTRDIIDGQIAKVGQDYDVSTKLQEEIHIDVDRIRIEENDMSQAKATSKHQENVSVDEGITKIEQKVISDSQGSIEEKIAVVNDVDRIRTEENDMSHVRSTSKHQENITIDESVTKIEQKVAADNTKSTDEQIAIVNDVDQKREEAQNILATASATKYNESVTNKQTVENIYQKVGQDSKNSERELIENNQEIQAIEQSISNRNSQDSKNKHHSSIIVNDEVKTIHEKVSEDDKVYIASKVATSETIKDKAEELRTKATLKTEENKLKNNDTKELIENQIIRDQANSDLALLKQNEKNEQVKQMEASIYKTNGDLNKSDDQERLTTQRDLDLKNDGLRERNQLEKDRLTAKGEQVKDTEKALMTGSTSRAAEKRQSSLDAKKEIDKIEEKPVETVRVPNTLGEKYPEGVSQEMFQRKDNAGILLAIITRRVVVIEGRGNEYVKTQTNTATTYSKNGKPITEYVWQKETQDAKLQRHY